MKKLACFKNKTENIFKIKFKSVAKLIKLKKKLNV